MENTIPKIELSTKFYGEVPGLRSPEGRTFRIKAGNFNTAAELCKNATSEPHYFYIVEAYPDINKEHYQMMPSIVDVIKVTPFNTQTNPNFEPPFESKEGIITNCKTIEDFVLQYRKPERFLKENEIYQKAILLTHYYDIITKGYTHVSKHDNITGNFLTYQPDLEIFRNIVGKYAAGGFMRTAFEIPPKVKQAACNYRQRIIDKNNTRQRRR